MIEGQKAGDKCMEDDDDKVTLPIGSKRIMIGAAVFSLVWLIAASIIAWAFHCGVHAPLKINEWGDYAAGASAPLAFLWLVVAVFLQSRELREQRQELSWTRKEFKENRTVMREQATEAKNQASFIKTQTDILKKSSDNAEAEDIFAANVDLIATRLRQYTNAWSMVLEEGQGPDGIAHGVVLGIRTKFYGDATDKLVIAKTVQLLRTKIREMKTENPKARLHAQYPYDFQRIYRAVMEATDSIAALPASYQIKARTLELDELKEQLHFLGDHAGVKPFDPISRPDTFLPTGP